MHKTSIRKQKDHTSNAKSTEMIEDCHKHEFTFSEFVNITEECAPTDYHWNLTCDEIDD